MNVCALHETFELPYSTAICETHEILIRVPVVKDVVGHARYPPTRLWCVRVWYSVVLRNTDTKSSVNECCKLWWMAVFIPVMVVIASTVQVVEMCDSIMNIESHKMYEHWENRAIVNGHTKPEVSIIIGVTRLASFGRMRTRANPTQFAQVPFEHML